MTNWFVQGNHVHSSFQPNGGINDSACLHVRASGHGDTGANRIRTKLSAKLVANKNATLRAHVRWLRGWPEILLRTRGNWMEAPGVMAVPRNLGTPGARNSKFSRNAGPAIYGVTHSPAVPSNRESVTVTARVHDPDGIGSLTLNYRLDPANILASVPMVDDGTRGDDIAGDGVFTAIIPSQPLNTLVAFYVKATDKFSPAATTTFPSDSPTRECLVRFGEPRGAGRFGTYRLWITKATADTWTKREKLSNEPLDATFVYDNQRVVYNAGAYFSGSPYHSPGYTTPTGAPCNYDFLMPPDDQVLGTSDFKKLHWPGNSADDATAQREEASYWFLQQMGLPFNHTRYVNLYVNGTRRGEIFEDMQVPNGDMVKQWFPNDNNGDLFKIAGWFEFSDTISAFNTTWATLQNFTTTGGKKKQARYRWNWQKRAVKGSAHDFTSLFDLVDVVNNADAVSYRPRLESLVDMDNWLGVIALQHLVGNWDSYGDGNGQNMYTYKGPVGKWSLMTWDLNIDLDIGYGDGPTSDLFKTGDPVVGRMFADPEIRRAYWQVLIDAVNGPWQTNSVGPLLDAKFAALKANGANVASPAGIKKFVATRRNYVLQQLSRVDTAFAVSTTQGLDFTSSKPSVKVSGFAPFQVATILFDGNEYPLTWISAVAWSVNLPLRRGVNAISIQGYDRHGNLLTNAATAINITYTGTAPALANHVVINEWMAANTKTIIDPADGQFNDWFELYNPTASAIDLSGFALSESLTNTAEFVIPAGTRLAAHGFLLVWADKQTTQNAPGSDLHVNFNLSPGGQAIALFAPNGTLVDSVEFAPQRPDVSEGRWPDGAGEPFVFMSLPTPRGANTPDNFSPPPIQLTGIAAAPDGTVTIRWAAQPGRTYHFQYKTDLSETFWHNLSGDVLAAGVEAIKIDRLPATVTQRFYRIQELPYAPGTVP